MTASLAAPLTSGRRLAFAFYGVSLALHGALFGAIVLARPPAQARATPVSVEIVETRPQAPPPEPAPEPPRAEPPPLRPPPRVARAPRPRLPEDAPPPPPREAPPPPNSPPSAETKPGPIRIGISMSSTTVAGGYAAPTGNTLYGKAPERAEDPGDVKPLAADHYVPPGQVTNLPEGGCDIPKTAYPEEARRLGIEGVVKVRLLVDRDGNVRNVKVVQDPGHGLGRAAQGGAMVHCRFQPARKDGEAVATEIPYTIRFELP